MPITTGQEALRQVPLFSALGDSLLDDLAAELGQAEFAAGEPIFNEGDASSALYVVRSGKVKIVRSSGEKELVLAVFSQGDYFGELSLCDDSTRSAAAVALEATSTYILPQTAFHRFIGANPGAATCVMSVLAARLRVASERLSDAVFLEFPARLAKRLLELAAEHGRETALGTEIPCSLTADEIASLAGGTAEQVESEMRSLMEGDVVEWDGTTVTVRSRVLLEERSRGGRRYMPLGQVTVPRWLLDS